MLGAACPATSLSTSREEFLRVWKAITVLCVCPGAQQLLGETWSTEQSADVFTVGANQSPDGENLAALRGKAQRKLQHAWDWSLVEVTGVFRCVFGTCMHHSFIHNPANVNSNTGFAV